MRLAGMISLILVLSMLTGSSPWLLPQAGAAGPVEDTPGAEKLLARQEEKLLAYEAELLQAAEELLSAKAGESAGSRPKSCTTQRRIPARSSRIRQPKAKGNWSRSF